MNGNAGSDVGVFSFFIADFKNSDSTNANI